MNTPNFQPLPSHPRFMDISGHTYGCLSVLGYAGCVSGKHSMWWCKCQCGSVAKIAVSKLRNGHTKSCGCLKRKAHNKTHGLTNTRIHRIWSAMKTRCLNPNFQRYADYGGRGIKVCDRWMHFLNFFQDMGHPPTDQHSLDRIDNDGNYEPANCRWATHSQQARNTHITRFLTLGDERLPLHDWAERLEVPAGSLVSRLIRGWSDYDTLTVPVKPRPAPIVWTFQNRTQTLYEWADELGIKWQTLHGRMRRGWSVEQILTTPILS